MPRGLMIGPLLVGGCLLANPAFDDEAGAGSGSGAASGTGTTAGTAGPTGDATGPETGGGTGTGGETTGAVGGSSSGGCDGCVCTPGAMEPCYGGEPGTEGVGVCAAGVRTCELSGAAWGACEGEVTPSPEVCGDGLDQDCDGVADDDASCMIDPECPRIAGLVACYPFPDGVTDELRDGSGKQHHGAMSGVSLVAGLQGEGKAGKFGMGSAVSVPEHPELSPDTFTVALLIRPSIGLATAGLVDKDNQFGLFHYPQGGLECVVVSDMGEIKSAQLTVPAGVWSMLVCSFDGAQVTLRRYSGDPEVSKSTPMSGKLGPNGSGMRIGSNSPQGDLLYAGDLDRVLLFDRALGSQELCALAGSLCP